MLDNRLKLCAKLVSGKGIACDVGTDHAYLATDLILTGKCEKVIASDISQGPLDCAKATVQKYNVSDKVSLVLTNGLENVDCENVTDVVIAGMGGETIIDIINGVKWLQKDVFLILQPMSKSEILRKWLYENGFEIIVEEAVKEERFIYSVIKARYTGKKVPLLEVAQTVGFFDFSQKSSQDYMKKCANKLNNIAVNMIKAGKNELSNEKNKLYNIVQPLSVGDVSTNIGTVYDVLNEIIPFKNQEKWDNSGLLIGSRSDKVTNILVCLDITNKVIDEAIEKGIDLIISHHPIIFDALKFISSEIPVYRMISNKIGAICTHTSYDIGNGGLNDVIVDKISEILSINGKAEILEFTGENVGIGRVFTLEKEITAKDFATYLKQIFKCEVVRYSDNGKTLKKVALCSGSGGSMLDEVLKKECDCFITGDVKHDVWILADNNNAVIFDCGHFYTENIATQHLTGLLKANLPFIKTFEAQSSVDYTNYL